MQLSALQRALGHGVDRSWARCHTALEVITRASLERVVSRVLTLSPRAGDRRDELMLAFPYRPIQSPSGHGSCSVR